jgi:hypothetical protein
MLCGKNPDAKTDHIMIRYGRPTKIQSKSRSFLQNFSILYEHWPVIWSGILKFYSWTKMSRGILQRNVLSVKHEVRNFFKTLI